jgi:hypothetical protein
MDKVTFDSDGLMYCTITDTPQPAPGTVAKEGVPQSIPISINKVAGSDPLSKWSSAKEGFPAAFADDNYSGTVWMPEDDDKEPFIMIDLGPATRFDVVQLFKVDAMRVMFTGARRGFGMGPGAAAPALPVYKYKVDVSLDGEHFTTVLDKTGNTVPKDTIFEEFPPSDDVRFARLTITDWPKESPLGIIEVTFFGTPGGYLPAEVATPVFSKLPMDSPEYQQRVRIE